MSYERTHVCAGAVMLPVRPVAKSLGRSCAARMAIAAVSALFAYSLTVPAIASPVAVDLLPGNTSLGIYLDKFPSNLNESKIYLQDTNGTTVHGNVGSQNGSPVVNFTSPSQLDPANGFANIVGVSGDYSKIAVSVPGYTFGDLLFDTQIDEATDKSLNLTISAYDDATLLGSLTLTDKTGLKKRSDQSWLVLAEGNATITSVVIESTTGLFETKHFQISDLALIPNPGPGPGNTPLPGAGLLMLSTLAGGTGVGIWRRRRRAAA